MQTEVGRIPVDWAVSSLGQCLLSRPDYGINARAVEFTGKLPVYIRITDITEEGRFSPEKRVSVQGADTEQYFLKEGELVFARTGASVGKSYLYNAEDGRLVFAGFLIRVRPDPAKLIPSFLAAYVRSGRYWSWVSVMSTRSGQPGINGNEYTQLPIPLPRTDEQRAIATAISDTDALIASLDKLITKKQDMKTAVMQQLVTGKRRLPGFSGKWELKRLGDVGACIRGVTYKGDGDLSPYDTPRTKRLLRANNVQDAIITTDDIQFVNAARVSMQQVMRKGDILVCMASGSRDLAGKAAAFELSDGYEYTFGAFMGCFRSSSASVESSFVHLLFQTGLYRAYIANLLAGSSINNLRPSAIESLEFSFPDTQEQSAIAAVVSDIDAEIAALLARREKTKALKQGMMQQLLTGEIRLIV